MNKLQELYSAYTTNYEALVILSLDISALEASHPEIFRGSTLCSPNLEQAELKLQAALDELEQLVIVGLYALFEQLLTDQWEREAVQDTTRPGTDKSFAQLMQLRAMQRLRPQDSSDLLKFYLPRAGQPKYEAVDNVRKFRNWIAHGRRGNQPVAISPQQTHLALETFLTSIAGPSARDE